MRITTVRAVLFISVSALLAILASAVTQYHEQGLHGHHSYKYGFDTGDHFNPQQRYEEADGHGNVKGSFSYMDGSGHKVTVYYKAGKNGFYRSDDPANHKMKESASHAHHVSPSHHHPQHHTGSHHHNHHNHNHHHHHPRGMHAAAASQQTRSRGYPPSSHF